MVSLKCNRNRTRVLGLPLPGEYDCNGRIIQAQNILLYGGITVLVTLEIVTFHYKFRAV